MEPLSITAIIGSAHHVFRTCFAMDLDARPNHSGPARTIHHDLAVSVRIGGPTPTTIAATFPMATAHRLAVLLVGHDLDIAEDGPDIADAMGALLDMIAGRAAGALPRSRPDVAVFRPAGPSPECGIPCFCTAGELTLAANPAPAVVSRPVSHPTIAAVRSTPARPAC